MLLTIGQAARAAEVNTETLRYYEREGLLPSPGRTPAGYRQYTADAVRRVRFMKRAQALGFTLREIGALLELRAGRASSCGRVASQAEQAIARVDVKIRELRRMRAALGSLVRACRGRRPTADCPILDALEAQ